MSLPRLFLACGLSAALSIAPAVADPAGGGEVVRVAVAAQTDAAPATSAAVPLPKAKPDESASSVTKVAAAAGAAVAAKPAEVAKAPPPAPTLKISIDLTKQQMSVQENGKAIHTWAISSGRAGFRTPTGTYRPQWMTTMHYSRKYDNAPMPHSIFFHKGYAIHATYATGMLGRPASHGCIRLSPANAKRLYALVGKHTRARTRISIHGVAKDRPAPVASTQKRTVRRSYEPPRGYHRTTPTYSFGYPAHARTWPGDRPRRLRYGY